MLVDTGATFSCVRQDVADRLGLPDIGTARVLGVNSSRDCRIVSALLGVFPADRTRPHLVPFIVADIGVPVIFGMPEIARGLLVVDGRNGTWSWTVRAEDFGGRPAEE
jgi:predicted aspartyl protease